MALPIVIAKNQTGGAIALLRLGIDVPASPATLTLTDFYSFYEIGADPVLNAAVAAATIVINNGTSDLSPTEGNDYLDTTGSVSSSTVATNDLGGTYGAPTVVSASGAFAFKATYTPALASGNNNDYSIAGIVTMNAQGGAGGSTLTGFAGGTAGRLLIIQNFATNPITIANNDVNSAAANRISYSGPTIVLQENQSAVLQYESSGFATVWRVVVRPDVLGTASTWGDLLFYNGSAWELLPAGTAGQLLQTNGSGADPAWVTSAAGGGGSGSATLNFGATPGTNVAEVAVTGQAAILAGSQIQVWMVQSTTASHNAYEHSIVPIKLTAGDILPGTGFTIRGVTDWRLDGTFTVQWSWK